jgi:DNA topoisomerase-3
MDRLNFRSALNVAEKPSVAKTVSEILSRGNSRKLHSDSKFNPVFEFDYQIGPDIYRMVFTSVRGHLTNIDFGEEHQRWIIDRVIDLYDAEIYKSIVNDCRPIESNLKKLARNIDTLILWLDCDREGENIAYEVIDVVKIINPRVNILRAQFSALTDRDVIRAANTLQVPNKNLSDAVEIRKKIDLIIGASFTRIQTLTFRNLFYGSNEASKHDQKNVISYGPCQFPTLNFIVERAEKIRKFKPEEFYYIELTLCIKESNQKYDVTFNWERQRFFDKIITLTIYEKVLESKKSQVVDIKSNSRTRLRPLPLNTVEMQKLISKKLRISSHETMEICEKLYQKGFISYPRTETQKFGKNEILNLKKLVEEQTKSRVWGDYAEILLKNDEEPNQSSDSLKYTLPRTGKLDDKAHPPIHPVKFADPSILNEKEKRIYELLVRHFLACVSPDAKGEETVVTLLMGGEYFSSKGLIITSQGYLQIYTYDKWTDNYMPNFSLNDEIIPSKLLMQTGKTSPPSFLTEAELISLMDKHGIGTDATIHEHIKHIQDRGYSIQSGNVFKPTLIGTALIKSYEALGLELYKPYLRAQMEADMKEVCEGRKSADNVFREMKREMRNIFNKVFDCLERMKDFLSKFINDNRDYESQINVNLNLLRRGPGGGNGGYGGNGGVGGNNDIPRGDNFNQGRNHDGNNNNNSGDEEGSARKGKKAKRGAKRGGKIIQGHHENYNNNSNNNNNSYDNPRKKIKKRENTNNNNILPSYEDVDSDNEANKNKFNNNFGNQTNTHNKSENTYTTNTHSYKNNSYSNNNILKNNSNFKQENPFSKTKFNNSSNDNITSCPKCSQNMRLVKSRANQYFIGCSTYPTCKSTLSINNPLEINLSNQRCKLCKGLVHQATYIDEKQELICLGPCLLGNQSKSNIPSNNLKRKYDNTFNNTNSNFNNANQYINMNINNNHSENYRGGSGPNNSNYQENKYNNKKKNNQNTFKIINKKNDYQEKDTSFNSLSNIDYSEFFA